MPQKCILPPLKQNAPPHQGIEANKSIMQQLIQATNRKNKVCEETNRIQFAEYEWKKESDEVKKDRTKDLHPSIRNLIENASATKRTNQENSVGNSSLSTTAKRMEA
jgi:hypothetical protein